jgi:two-component system, OmpR family, osmolarity sensor histidine kinase EnvZ
MTLLPRSLLARTFLAIAAILVLAMGAWFAIVRIYEFEPRALQTARMVVSIVNLTRTALYTSQPDLRRELLFDLAEREGIRIYPADTEFQTDPAPDTAFMRRVLELARESLGRTTRFAQSREDAALFLVSFRIEEDEYWIGMDPERLNRPLTRQLAGWGLAALVLALAGAYLIVFRIREPVGALTTAAREIGRGRYPAPLPEEGPDELRTLAVAFNQMTRDLARLDDDRALILAGVSHDLRTPLARLRLGIELSGADAQTRNDMSTDIDEMDRIIGQFLDFARSETSEKLVEVDLAALAREIGTQYRERGQPLDLEIAPTPPRRLRALAIRRLIVNLLDNAYRYAGDGIALRTGSSGRDAIVEVLDRGPGIPPDQVERLKQPFQRLESARTNVGGSGLGLAIVERIARMHGGRFDLAARDGGGLVARVSFPGGGVG